VDEIEIRWPSGLVQRLQNISTNQILNIREGAENRNNAKATSNPRNN